LQPFGRSPAFQLGLLTLAAMAGAYTASAISPLQESVRLTLGLSDNEIALLQGPALAIPMLLAAFPLGLAIARYSRVRLLLILALFNVVGMVITAVAPGFSLLFAARCFIGLTSAATSTVTYALVADLYPPDQRGRSSMVLSVGLYVGVSAAFALGGLFAPAFGSGAGGWRLATLCQTVPLVLIVPVLLAMREPPRTDVVAQKPSARQMSVELWRYRSIIAPLLIGSVMIQVAIRAVLTWAAPMLARSFLLPADRVGGIMATVVLVGGVLGPILGGLLADLCQRTGGPKRTMSMLIGAALLCTPGCLFADLTQFGAASALLALFAIVVGAIDVSCTVAYTIVIPHELLGMCIALLAGAQVLFAIGFAPMAVSLLSGVLGGPATIGKALALVCVSSCVVAATAFSFARGYLPRLRELHLEGVCQ